MIALPCGSEIIVNIYDTGATKAVPEEYIIRMTGDNRERVSPANQRRQLHRSSPVNWATGIAVWRFLPKEGEQVYKRQYRDDVEADFRS
jgi:hypothetical protein